MTPATYDPEKALWLPNRRKFFLMGLAAGVAPFLPDIAPAQELKPLLGSWESASWVAYESLWIVDGTVFTVEVVTKSTFPHSHFGRFAGVKTL